MKPRILAVDYGRVRLGLAVTDALGLASHPLPALQRTGAAAELAAFKALIADRDVVRLVVGLPLNMDGTEGPMAAEARGFGAWLKNGTGLEVEFEDERLSTDEAEEFLQSAGLRPSDRKKLRDSVAAALVLRSVLERERGGGQTPEPVDAPQPAPEPAPVAELAPPQPAPAPEPAREPELVVAGMVERVAAPEPAPAPEPKLESEPEPDRVAAFWRAVGARLEPTTAPAAPEPAEPEPAAEIDQPVEPEPEPAAEVAPPEPAPAPQTAAVPEPAAEPVAEPETTTEPEAAPEPEAQSEPESQRAPEAPAEPEAEPVIEPETAPASAPARKTMTKPAAKSRAAPKKKQQPKQARKPSRKRKR